MLFHIDPLRLWVHKVLPVVYDDSLSYYEVLAKVTKKLNEVIDLTEEQNQYIEEFSTNLTNAINNWEDGMEREWSSYKSGLNNEWGAFQRNTEQYIENWKNMAESDIEDAIAAGINQFVSYFSDLTQTAVDAAERAMEAAETAAQDAVDAVMPTLESEFDERYAWKTAVGSPLVATTAAGMTDTTKVYVYAGSESGYVNGDWYYYDGTAWQDGGVYNSVAVVTDTTLSEAGVPADAKAAGDEIADLKYAFTDTMLQSVVGAAITAGKAVRADTGVDITAASWARTSLWNAHPTRSGFNLPDNNFVYRIHFYDSTGNISNGTGYLGYSGVAKSGVQYIPKTFNGTPVAKVCVCFQTADASSMTSADAETLKAEFASLYATDTSLTIEEIPADAKATGERITEAQTSIMTELTAVTNYNLDQSLITEPYTVPKFRAGTVSASVGTINTGNTWKYNSSMESLLTVNSTVNFVKTNWRYRLFYYDKYGVYLGSPSIVREGFTNIKYEAAKAYADAALFRIMFVAWDETTDTTDTDAPALTDDEAQEIADDAVFETILTAMEESDKANGVLLKADGSSIVQGFWTGKAIANTVINANPLNYASIARPVFAEAGSIIQIEGLSASDLWSYNVYVDNSLTAKYTSGWVNSNELTVEVSGWVAILFKHSDASQYDLSSFTGKIDITRIPYRYWSNSPFVGTTRLGYNNTPLWNDSDRNAVQGIAVYNGIMFQALGNTSFSGKIQTYDLNTGEAIALFDADTGHGNTINFGKKKYDPSDEFPLLYCSSTIGTDVDSQHLAIRVVNVLRVTRNSAQTIKTYQLPDASIIGYHAQASIDENNGVFVISTYKYFGQWREYTEGDELIISVTKPLETATYNEVTQRYETEKAKSFELPWCGYLQEGKAYGGYYWLLFSQPNTDDTTIYVIDYAGGMLRTTLTDWTATILNEEAEGIDFVENNDGKSEMVMAVGDNGTLRVYKIALSL